MNDSTDTRRREAEAFLDALFADRAGHLRFALGHEGHHNGDGRYVFTKWHERIGQWPDCREKFIEDALRLSDDGVDVYVCPYLGTTSKREQGTAKPSGVLYADDAPPNTHDARWLIVDSGGGDADSFHVYALTTEDMESADLMSGNRRMRAATGGDSKVSDNDVLRLPGTRNHKTGNLVRLVQDGTPTPLEALGLPDDPGVAEAREVDAEPAEGFDVSKLPPHLRIALNEEPSGDRSAQTYGFIREAQSAGLDEATILGFSLSTPATRSKPWPRKALNAPCSSVAVEESRVLPPLPETCSASTTRSGTRFSCQRLSLHQ